MKHIINFINYIQRSTIDSIGIFLVGSFFICGLISVMWYESKSYNDKVEIELVYLNGDTEKYEPFLYFHPSGRYEKLNINDGCVYLMLNIREAKTQICGVRKIIYIK